MERRKVKGMIMIMILSTVFSMFYTIRHTTDRLNLTEVEAHAGTGILEDPEYDVFPYISFVIDTPKDLLDDKYGYSYRTLLEYLYPEGTWEYINNSKSEDDIDVLAVFKTSVDGTPFRVQFQYVMPHDSEIGTEHIEADYGGDTEKGTEMWDRIVRSTIA